MDTVAEAEEGYVLVAKEVSRRPVNTMGLTDILDIEGRSQKKSEKGIPQGSPLSPILMNIYLHAMDKELSSQHFRYSRYADDFIIGIRESPQRPLFSSYIENLKKMIETKVNHQPPDCRKGKRTMSHIRISTLFRSKWKKFKPERKRMRHKKKEEKTTIYYRMNMRLNSYLAFYACTVNFEELQRSMNSKRKKEREWMKQTKRQPQNWPWLLIKKKKSEP
jgi:hypothetical protein